MLEKQKISEIYKHFGKELYVYIYRFTGSAETSEDILQDTFHNLIKYAEKHTVDQHTAKAFLYRTAHNICINFKKRQERISFPSLEEAENIPASSMQESSTESKELKEKIYSILETADPLSRSIFIMKKELDMDLNEIAENTGKSVRTIRRRLSDLLNNMHNILKESGYILFFLFFKVSIFAASIVI